MGVVWALPQGSGGIVARKRKAAEKSALRALVLRQDAALATARGCCALQLHVYPLNI
jgi:hypothetical protein